MNVGEYGNILRVNLKEDISSFTNTMRLISPVPYYSVKEITSANGLTVGTVPVDVGGEIFQPNEYLEYTIQVGDIFMAGAWEVKTISVDTVNDKCMTNDDKITFNVDP